MGPNDDNTIIVIWARFDEWLGYVVLLYFPWVALAREF